MKYLALIVVLTGLTGCMRTYSHKAWNPDGSGRELSISLPPTDSQIGKLTATKSPDGTYSLELEGYGVSDRQADLVTATSEAMLKAIQAAK